MSVLTETAPLLITKSGGGVRKVTGSTDGMRAGFEIWVQAALSRPLRLL